MEDWLGVIVAYVAVVIQIMAVLVVSVGTLQAFFHVSRAMVRPSPDGVDFHKLYTRFARWLVAGLTFQLAADVVHTAFAPSWDEIGKLAAIAAIRAFINYFLEHDLAREEQRLAATAIPPDGSDSAARVARHSP